MKATRKLIPAFAMLLIAAVMMSTATFAWFSTNTSVTAGGMSIQAKSETIFLQIVNANTAFNDDLDQINADAVVANTTVAPVHPAKSLATDLKTIEKYTDADTAIDFTKIVWVTAFSNKVDSSAKPAGSLYTDISSTIESNVLKNTFSVRLNPSKGGKVVSGENLTINNVEFDQINGTEDKSLLSAVRILVAGPDGVAIFDESGTLIAGTAILASTLKADGTPVELTVYVYFDGEDTDCHSNNVEFDEKYTVTFKLDITAA